MENRKDIHKNGLPRTFVKRYNTRVNRDTSRVITLPLMPDISRIPGITDRVLRLPERKAKGLLQNIYNEFASRHKNIEKVFLENYDRISEYITYKGNISIIKKLLTGAYFTMEYSIESAALFNPSIVPHPDQTGVRAGCLRFIMSLRATGEGHISSIVFRSGMINSRGSIQFDPLSHFVETPRIRYDKTYDRHLFRLKLLEVNAWSDTSSFVLDRMAERFTFKELRTVISELLQERPNDIDDEAIRNIYWLADSNYFINFESHNDISERVIFPISKNESRGIEDARFVMFTDDDGEVTYYATYTAFNGVCILPILLKTTDFIDFDIMTLNGKAVQNKGMALFPRKINGKYVMLSRQDGENNYIMFSDHLHFWQEAKIIQRPTSPWEFLLLGNCGSPIETSEGWIVLTHGVGPMRQYSIGAILLDLEDPSKMIARLEEPLLMPNKEEREGYVPNVVYSCGSLIHHNMLIIPYAMSDITSGFATVKVRDLLNSMKSCKILP